MVMKIIFKPVNKVMNYTYKTVTTTTTPKKEYSKEEVAERKLKVIRKYFNKKVNGDLEIEIECDSLNISDDDCRYFNCDFDQNTTTCAMISIFDIYYNNIEEYYKVKVLQIILEIIADYFNHSAFEISDSKRSGKVYPYLNELYEKMSKKYKTIYMSYPTGDEKSTMRHLMFFKRKKDLNIELTN